MNVISRTRKVTTAIKDRVTGDKGETFERLEALCERVSIRELENCPSEGVCVCGMRTVILAFCDAIHAHSSVHTRTPRFAHAGFSCVIQDLKDAL